jgi:hypothetical protein
LLGDRHEPKIRILSHVLLRRMENDKNGATAPGRINFRDWRNGYGPYIRDRNGWTPLGKYSRVEDDMIPTREFTPYAKAFSGDNLSRRTNPASDNSWILEALTIK